MIRRLVLIALIGAAPAVPAVSADRAEEPSTEPPSIAEAVGEAVRTEGLFDLHLDPRKGKVWIELPPADASGFVAEAIYVEGLRTGLGSNPVGLDRGQIGPSRLVRFRRVGDRLVVEEPNLRYRARSDLAPERRAVRESFATSILWAAEVAGEEDDGRFVVDLTDFVVRDAHGVVDRLRETDQGSFALDEDRSLVDASACHAFPDNVELEAILTFASQQPGRHVRSTAPTGEAVTLVQHQSFVRLPDDGYRPREGDPRAGIFGVVFDDYAVPLDGPMRTWWIARHRLQRSDPESETSPAVDPIVYYVDPGTPEPIRSALVEGARWWEEAFEAAGYEDAFRVEILPEDAHPLDVRYNVIQWVHRSTRGWSYGNAVTDPRTGEIIKGHVSLGSLRVRQDIRIFEGLLGAGGTGTGAPDDPVELALARIRQLSAHEVGHTLGLAHNFAASTYGRASVMDYPAPLVEVGEDGSLDVSRAYDVGVGSWDIQAIRYAYTDFPAGSDEEAALDALVREGIEAGLEFLSDADARPSGAAHPAASLWDNGSDPVAALDGALEVRRVALERFGRENVADGRPLALLHEVLVPLYLYHRYQLQAAGKLVGGVDYAYVVRGDGRPGVRPVPGEDQRRAVQVLLGATSPEALDLGDGVLSVLLPRPFGWGPNRELFEGRTDPVFDPLGAAATAADLALAEILQPERLGRLVDGHRRDQSLPSLEEVLSDVVEATFPPRPPRENRQAEIQRVVQGVVTDRLVALATDESSSFAVRSRVEAALDEIRRRVAGDDGLDAAERAHREAMARDLRRFFDERTWTPKSIPGAPKAPPGSPIGGLGCGMGGER